MNDVCREHVPATMRPGDLIRFHGLVGEDRGPCLVIAVYPWPDVEYPGKRVLLLTRHRRLLTLEMGGPDDDRPWTLMNDD